MKLNLKEVYEGIVRTNANPWAGSSAPQIPVRAKELLEPYKKALASKGIDIGTLKVLGHGALGSAFALADGTVLKVTSDQTEAAAAKHTIGKNFKNVYKVFGVYQLGNKEKHFVIWQELLDRAPIASIFGHSETPMANAFYGIKSNGFLEPTGAPDSEIKLRVGDYDLPPEQKIELFDILHDVSAGLKELNSIGIKFHDFHLNNILFRHADDRYVIIDLGDSNSPRAEIDDLAADPSHL